MNTILTLIALADAIALLLWGVHLVQSGIQRAFGPHLTPVLRDLKRIDAHVAAAAYAVLEKRGELLSSRLRRDEEMTPQ